MSVSVCVTLRAASSPFPVIMLIDEERECSVCFQEYSRSDRIPRTLHCEHTFCDLCLQRMCHTDSVMYYVSCPLCRRITCSTLTLPGGLYVNTNIWDELAEKQQEMKDRPVEDFKDARGPFYLSREPRKLFTGLDTSFIFQSPSSGTNLQRIFTRLESAL